jgi:mRNA interferase MazF
MASGMISRGQIHFTLVVAAVGGADAANISRDYPVNVRVTAAESGLPRDTVFLCFQVRSLGPSRLIVPATTRQ